MLHCVMNVFAAEVSISYNEDNNDYVIIKGVNKTNPGSKVTLSVFNKGKTYADLLANPENLADEKDILAFS